MANEKPDRISTNEEIISDLTSELRDAQFMAASDEGAHIPPDFENSDQESDDTKPPFQANTDESDDEALKIQKVDLTDEEKDKRRAEALTLKNTGNEEFKCCKYMESVKTYTEALRLCPLKFDTDRAILYANRAASKIKVERKQSAIEDCTKAIKLNENYVRAYLRRARMYEETNQPHESLEDYKKILELDPGNKDALGASVRLPPLINERNEKLKDEMLGKLKDVGNLILKPFGLSTDNFKVRQDPNTGGYTVNF